MTGEAFFDSNVPLYLLSGDAAKAGRAEDLLTEGGALSVQVLNEVAAVARRKQQASWPAIEELLAGLRRVCRVEALTLTTHQHALALAKHHGFHIYDACIVASAIEAGCRTLYSEDMQHGRIIERVTVINPFR